MGGKRQMPYAEPRRLHKGNDRCADMKSRETAGTHPGRLSEPTDGELTHATDHRKPAK